jgi:hypothetical protein
MSLTVLEKNAKKPSRKPFYKSEYGWVFWTNPHTHYGFLDGFRQEVVRRVLSPLFPVFCLFVGHTWGYNDGYTRCAVCKRKY